METYRKVGGLNMEKIYKGEIQRLMPIFQAMIEGRTIQFAANGNSWTDIDGDEEGLFLDTLISTPQRYRIKPESNYRPFKGAEECWQEMQKHHPFGWVKHLYFFYYIVYVEDGMIGYANASGTILHDNFKDALGSFTFADGTPFGILEEE